jgi:integrase
VSHENRFCLEGVCPSQFVIFPDQTGTATSSPIDKTASQSNMNIVNVMLWMKKNAYEDSTIKKVAKLLRHLKRNCNTADPEVVKLFIANKACGNGHKENLGEAYDLRMQSEGLTWDKPFYQRYDKKRKAPNEKLVDFLINNARIEMKLKLSMFKDLGLRPIELTWLTIGDIDLTTGIVSITGAKHTIGREGKLKPKTLDLLKIFIKKKHLNANSRIYNGKSSNLSTNYRHYRNRIAEEYDMPELKQIQLYDFRRFKGSKEYHLTKSILRVKEILGHKDNTLRTTLKYISLFEDTATWIPIVCETDEEIKQAIQDDCILVCQANGKTFFKKPA